MKLYATGPIKHDGTLIEPGQALPDGMTDAERQALVDAGAASPDKPPKAEAEGAEEAPAAAAPKGKAGR